MNEKEEDLRRACREGIEVGENRGLSVFPGMSNPSDRGGVVRSTNLTLWQPSANWSLEGYRARITTVLDDKLFTCIGLSLETSQALLVKLANLHHMKLVPREDTDSE